VGFVAGTVRELADGTLGRVPNIADYPNDFKGYNQAVIDEFRANGGKVTGMFERAPLVLITTKGEKTGKPYTTPVVYTRDDAGNVVVIASKGGAPKDPQWYRNLVAHPDVTVELPGERYDARARVTQGDERRRLFDAQAARMPNFAEYQKKTSREIPVVVLERHA
jgi:deazaflavin-dependent oxidoreductase (nitroreductase family)